MKKSYLIAIFALFAVLCLCLAGCDLFGKPDNPDKPDGDAAVKLSELQIGADKLTFDYTGQPVTFDVRLFRGNELIAEIKAGQSHPDLEVVFLDNVEIGAGEVIVKAKSGSKKFIGQVKTDFEIRPRTGTVYASDFASLKQYLSNKAYGSVGLSADVTIPANERLTVLSTAVLRVTKRKLTVLGELTVAGELVLGNSYDENNKPTGIDNRGKLVINDGARFVFNDGGILFNRGQLQNLGSLSVDEKYKRHSIYSDVEINVDRDIGIDVYLRKSLSSPSVSLTEEKYDYNGKAIVPLLQGEGQQGVDYDIVCENNVNAGICTAAVTATELSRYYYGQRTFEFEIRRIPFQTEQKEAFLSALNSPNYSVVSFTPQYSQWVDVTVLPDVTVNLNKCSVGALSMGANSVLNISGDCTVATGGGATVGKDAEINVLAGSSIVMGSVSGGGRINVNVGAELFFASQADKPAAQICNGGSLYADFDLSDVTGEGQKTVRSRLDASKLTVFSVDYNGKGVDASVSFPHDAENNYVFYYYFDGGYTSLKKPTNRGVYGAKLVFGDRNRYYTGETEFNFSVVKGVIDVSNQTELNQAVANGNYDRYRLDDWQINAPFTINAGDTVIVNRCVNNNVLTVSGKLRVDGKLVNNSGKSVAVENGGEIEVSVGGFFYNVDETSLLTLSAGSAFLNDGIVCLCADNAQAIEGIVRVRTRNLTDAVFSDFTEAVYGADTTPAFVLSYSGEQLDVTRFGVSYLGNRSRTTENGASVTVSAELDDVLYYGKAVGRFTVLGGKTTVSTGGELLAALNNTVYGTDLCNWAEIETSAKIYLHENNKQGQVDNYHVGKGTTLVVKHRIEYWDSVPNKEKFSFQNNGVIEFRDGGTIEDAYLWQKDSDGSFRLYVSDKSHLSRSGDSATYDYIRLENDIYVGSGDSISLYASANGVTLDLNGHTVKGIEDKTALNVYTRGKTVTILNGAIQPTLKLEVGTKYDASDGVGNVVLQRVTHGVTQNASGIPVEE